MSSTEYTILDAAIGYGGWNFPQEANISEEFIRDYFTRKNFQKMFGMNGCCEYCEDNNIDHCKYEVECERYIADEFSLEDCADAIIDWQNELKVAKEAREV